MREPIYAALARMVRTATASLDYGALYACDVEAQRSDGTLDLKPTNIKLPPMTGVPIRYGIPGVTVKVKPAARVLMGFDGFDPSRPYAALWSPDSLLELTIDAATKVTVSAPIVDVSATTATIDATSVTIAGGVQGIARIGDTVQAGPFAGVITSGSLKVKCG